MSSFHISTPRRYKDEWLIFPDSTISDLNLSDCNDTVHGVCENTKNIEDCIKICEENTHEKCNSGYFIETSGENFCVPLRKLTEDNILYYRIRPKTHYSQLSGLESSVFVLNKNNPFPPNIPNALFLRDNAGIKNVSANKWISMTKQDVLSEDVVFTDNNELSIQLLPEEILRTYSEQHIIIKNGDGINLNVPNTALILTYQPDMNDFKWKLQASSLETPTTTIYINSTDKNKPKGEPINYNEQFYFTFQHGIIEYVDSQKALKVINKSFDSALRDGNNVVFELSPQVEVFYCGDKGCSPMILAKTDRNGFTASYKGYAVSRSPDCWGKCPPKKSQLLWYLIIGIVVLVMIAILLIAL